MKSSAIPLELSQIPLSVAQTLLLEQLKNHNPVTFRVLNPASAPDLFAGETLELNGTLHLHRPLRVWLDLAEILNCELELMALEPDFLTLRFSQNIPTERDKTSSSDPEKYGAHTSFQRIKKLEEPYFLNDAVRALKWLELPPTARVLDLGVGSAEELYLLELAYPQHTFEVLGVDHSVSALELAKQRFPQHTFKVLDINNLPADLGKFDLIISIGTFQSANIDLEPLFRRLLGHLTSSGRWLLAFPNSRYIGSKLTYGARRLNYSHSELSLLFKDVNFFKRYFQKHRYEVQITGKYYVWIAARGIK